MVGQYSRSGRIINWIIVGLLILGAVLALAPLMYMLGTALKGTVYTPENPPQFIPDNPTLSAFQTAFGSRNFIQSIFNSLFVAIATMIMTVILAAMMGYSFARFKFL